MAHTSDCSLPPFGDVYVRTATDRKPKKQASFPCMKETHSWKRKTELQEARLSGNGLLCSKGFPANVSFLMIPPRDLTQDRMFQDFPFRCEILASPDRTQTAFPGPLEMCTLLLRTTGNMTPTDSLSERNCLLSHSVLGCKIILPLILFKPWYFISGASNWHVPGTNETGALSVCFQKCASRYQEKTLSVQWKRLGHLLWYMQDVVTGTKDVLVYCQTMSDNSLHVPCSGQTAWDSWWVSLAERQQHTNMSETIHKDWQGSASGPKLQMFNFCFCH